MIDECRLANYVDDKTDAITRHFHFFLFPTLPLLFLLLVLVLRTWLFSFYFFKATHFSNFQPSKKATMKRKRGHFSLNKQKILLRRTRKWRRHVHTAPAPPTLIRLACNWSVMKNCSSLRSGGGVGGLKIKLLNFDENKVNFKNSHVAFSSVF